MKVRTHGTGPLVVKIAGLVGGVGLYREEMERAARAGFCVAALDTSGDRRDDPAPGRLTWNFLSDEVLATLEGLGERRGILWGTSFGCLVALAAAARAPERVRGLLLCHPPEPRLSPAAYVRLAAWAETRSDPDAALRGMLGATLVALGGWEFLYPAALLRSPGLLREALDARTPPATVADKIRLLWGEEPGLPASAAAIPCSVVASAWDTIAPARGARTLAARIPGSRLRVLRFSGHAGAYSRPAAYGRIVVEELSRLTTNPSPRPEGGDEGLFSNE